MSSRVSTLFRSVRKELNRIQTLWYNSSSWWGLGEVNHVLLKWLSQAGSYFLLKLYDLRPKSCLKKYSRRFYSQRCWDRMKTISRVAFLFKWNDIFSIHTSEIVAQNSHNNVATICTS